MALNAKEKVKSIPSHSSGGGPGEALLLEKRPPPAFHLPHSLFGREREGGASRREAASLAVTSRPPPRMSAAALSAAVDSYNKQGTALTSHGDASPKEETSLFPATLREGARGRRFS